MLLLSIETSLARSARSAHLMMERLVVYVRYLPSLDPDMPREERDLLWYQLAGPLFDRASALGGRLIAWGKEFVTVDFSWDGLYDALDFLLDAPLAPELACGLCHGPVTVLHEGGRVAPSVGPALLLAQDLAELARPGEVLVSPELVDATGARIGWSGEAGHRPGKPEIAAYILDPERPLRDSMLPSSRPPEVSTLAWGESEPPASLQEIHQARLDAVTDTVRSTSLFPLAPSGGEDASPPSLRDIAESVRGTQSPELVERLQAMEELARGRSGEAIRRLRQAKAEADARAGADRCRAALALAVALLSAGRSHEALLEALEAVARARESEDLRGEKMCARFLARLSEILRDPISGAAWAELGV